jgi:multidrug efflux pump subunit AcrA (membrane-fusion protein)
VDGRAIPIVSGEESAQAQADARTASARAGSASAGIGEAQARVNQLALALEETEIKAPFDGVVTAVDVEPGMTVHAGDTVARVVGGGSGLRVRFAVGEEDAAILQTRRRAKITLESRTLFAAVDQVAPEVEPASRAFVVEGVVDGGDSACGPGGCAMVAGRAVRVQLDADSAAPVYAGSNPAPLSRTK